MDIQKAIRWFSDRQNMGLSDKCQDAENCALEALQEQAEHDSLKAHDSAAMALIDKLHADSAAKDQQIATLSAEVERLRKCRDGCKIDCLLDKYNEAQEQIAALKSELHAALETANMWTDAEGKRREENDTLKKALELMAMDLYDCHTANNVAIENAVANYIQQAQEQEGKK